MILVELTVSKESNFSHHLQHKQAPYNRQLNPGLHGSGWKAQLFTAEVRCRDFWHPTLPALFNYYFVTKRMNKAVLKEVALVAPMCSYEIWLAKSRVAATMDKDPQFLHQLSELNVNIKHV